MWDINDIQPEAVEAEREMIDAIVRQETRPVHATFPTTTGRALDSCDQCHRPAELFHNEATGLALCEACDMAAEDEQPVVKFKRLRNGAWGITGPSALLVTGTLVAVTKRSGEVTTVSVGKVVWSGDGKAIAATRSA